MAKKPTELKHELAYQEICQLIGRHGDDVTAIEMLAIAANVVGKLAALQDQRRYTPERVMDIIARNIEYGNEMAVAEILDAKGEA